LILENLALNFTHDYYLREGLETAFPINFVDGTQSKLRFDICATYSCLSCSRPVSLHIWG